MSDKMIGENFPAEAPDQLMPAGGQRIGASHVGGYGQNQYGGPSSLTPKDSPSIGQSGFLPGPGKPVNDQTRNLKGANVPDAFGMKKRP